MTDELARRVAAIANDRQHGAAELARWSLQLLADAAQSVPAASSEALRAELQRLAATLIDSRPSMTSVSRLIGAWQERCPTLRPLQDQRLAAMDAARSLIQESHAASEAAAQRAAQWLTACPTVMTHSYSSTVCAALARLQAGVQVIFSESRPLYEGHRLARALSEHGVHGTLVTDAQLGAAVQTADAVLVGADSVLADGSLVNKAGTLPLAATAAYFGVPFYGCCESYKFRTADMPDIVLERMSPDELAAPGWPGIEIDNLYFDVTPPDLLSGCITETGLARFPGYRAR